ncbi:MAG TPA: D-proline reductase (dithiol) proprotein PrdA [Terrisporobacter glycolicus]|uniref:D-proline reductase proprotein PrdA n=1 Tax=Terrisporobacter petrolearius TaxID=1460447 RepID=A0ABZ3FLK3_9FIRM|nr:MULTISPECIES: D-proline reductase (dithiol) proprotein PrdA [Terrisporobacter]MBN9648876.1 D-proline reductase (dithiol) proprotein PrdA [Terrisporobacter glycolicus]UPA30316.1 D-proline reductase (dithiol) proprotein PrdA [Terrisporobacter glycolicus]HBI92207.1 D-proline reductase (dithiol) proprotein PrdA [Terrisporobacter hibernicus]
MSITQETLHKHLKDPAIFCCRREKGLKISAADLEDPSLFDDMVDAGLLTLKDEGLTIEQVIGNTLLTDVEALTPITKDVLDKVNEVESAAATVPAAVKSEVKPSVAAKASIGGNGMIHVEIDKLEGLSLDIPAGTTIGGVIPSVPVVDEEVGKKNVIRKLIKKHIKILDAEIGKETSIKDGKITIDKSIVDKAVKEDELCVSLELDVIHPNERHIYTETIMDVCPIATKVEGQLGEGITKVADGVVFMLTGVDEDGVQVHEFGSSEGYLDEKMYYGHPGCADDNDIIIRCHAVIKRLTGMTRPGPFAAHKCQDYIIQAIRDELKKYEGEVVREEVCEDVRRKGKPRVVLVKEIMGQGAMHDNVLCPTEPCGVIGGQKNVDCGNVPIVLTPNQVRDGSIHALTCIGPATKEMTRHYIREPLVEGLSDDDELDLIGVVFVGSPQVNDEKLWVSERLGTTLEGLDIDGCIITTEGFGNNHIDFIQHIGQAGKRGIPVVGVSFCAYQGQLVVGNEYATAMVEENMDQGGFENNVAGCSCVTKEVAARAIQMLKNKMAGVEVLPAPKKWNNDVINDNNKLMGLPETQLLDNGTLH